jgi:DNA-binding CsgD family transcriptional regulator
MTTQGLLEAVTDLRRADSSQSLVGRAPGVIARLGFDRVLVSRIVNGVWLPETMFVRTDPRWAEAIVEAGLSEPTVLSAVVENDVVDFGKSFAVDEVQSHPRVHPSIAKVSRSDSYGVAPISIGSTVVGMLHADCYFQQRPVHQDECETLAVVAEYLAVHLSRLLLLEQLQTVHDQAWRSWRTVEAAARSPLSGRIADLEVGLSNRELDVIRLMAAGETNVAIGHHLAISEGTVKTHVSHILSKLDAVNRAQAVSRWISG